MEEIGSIVLIPSDVSRSCFFNGLVLSTKLNGVGADLDILGRIGRNVAVLIKIIALIVFYILAGLDFMSILLKNSVRLSCIDNASCNVLIRSTIPLLHYPVVEDVPGRSSNTCNSCGINIILIEIGICSLTGTGACIGVSQIIENTNTGRSVERLAPLSIKVELSGDPETILARSCGITIVIPTGNIGVGSCTVAPLIHDVCKVRRLVIRCGYGRIVQYERIGFKHVRERLVTIPTNEYVSLTVTCRSTDLSIITDTEVHCLALRTPVKSGVCTGIRMQEYTILDLTPLGIYSYAAFGHGCECIRFFSCRIEAPAFEYISGRRCSRFVIIERRYVSLIGNVIFFMNLGKTWLIKNGVVVTINIRTIQEVYRICLTCVIETDRTTAADIGSAVAECGIRTVLLVSSQRKEVLSFSKVIVFSSDRISVFHKALAVECSIRGLARKSLNIELHVLCTGRACARIECNILGRHDIYVYENVAERGAVLRTPTPFSACTIAGDREIVTDRLLIKCCYGFVDTSIFNCCFTTGNTERTPSIIICVASVLRPNCSTRSNIRGMTIITLNVIAVIPKIVTNIVITSDLIPFIINLNIIGSVITISHTANSIGRPIICLCSSFQTTGSIFCLKCQSVLITVVIYIDNGVIFWGNGNVFIKLCKVEACVLLVRIINACIGIISFAYPNNSTDGRTSSTRKSNSLFKVITISSNILSPDNDHITGRGLCGPLRIYNGFFS